MARISILMLKLLGRHPCRPPNKRIPGIGGPGKTITDGDSRWECGQIRGGRHGRKFVVKRIHSPSQYRK